MNLKNLQIKIADVLGVSSSQKELAYDTFIDKVLESLHEGLTLKVPRIGFFQLKAGDFRNGSNRSIIYSALSEDFDRDSRNLYLTINVKSKTGNTSEFDANVFSIGVGKPLLPLTVEEIPDSETSYAMLKKSIEERAREIISESDQIPNFDLFEGYYNTDEENSDESEDVNSTLSSLTADLDISHVEEPSRESFLPSDENFLNSLVHEPDEIEPIKDNQPEEPNLTDEINDTYEKEFGSEQNNVNEDETEIKNESAVENDEKQEEQKFLEDNENKQNELNEENGPNEQYPELSLAELLGSTISDTEKQNEELNADILEEEQPLSLSINEYLAQEEIPAESGDEPQTEKEIDQRDLPGTVTIETFLQQEEPQPGDEFSHEVGSDNINNEIEEKVENRDEKDEGEKDEEEKEQEKENESSQLEEIEESKKESEAENDEFFGLKVNDEDAKAVEQEESEPEIQNEVVEPIEKPDLKKDLFADLGNKIEELKLTTETEEGVNVNPLIEDNDFELNEDDLLRDDETNDEKIEWNWGDELKEEFGVNRFEGEEAKFEMVDDKENEINDAPLSNNKLYKDLFAQLEKTIEKEKTIFEEDFKADDWNVIDKEEHKHEFPEHQEEHKPRLTGHDERPTNKFLNKDDEKVYLEFSNPPSKYEFVAAKTPEQGRRMSVVLDEEPPPKYTTNRTYSNEVPPLTPQKPVEKDNYFGKIFILIFSAFVIISASIYFLLRNNSQQKNVAENNSITSKTKSEQSVVDSIIQAQIKKSNVDSSRAGLDEFDTFPTTAKPPVPIKGSNVDAAMNQNTQSNVSGIPKTEVEKINNGKSRIVEKSTNINPENDNSLYRTLGTDTRVSKTIYYDGSSYNFQTSSWRNRDKAEQEANRLRRLGYKAFIVSAYLPQKGGTWYRVRVGSFASQSEAQDFMNKNSF